MPCLTAKNVISPISSFIHESIRWLVSKGKVEEAEAVVRKIAKFNRRTLPDVLFEEKDIEEEMVKGCIRALHQSEFGRDLLRKIKLFCHFVQVGHIST